jgi:hypothetical protein
MVRFNCHDSLLAMSFLHYHDSYRQLLYSAISFYNWYKWLIGEWLIGGWCLDAGYFRLS